MNLKIGDRIQHVVAEWMGTGTVRHCSSLGSHPVVYVNWDMKRCIKISNRNVSADNLACDVRLLKKIKGVASIRIENENLWDAISD